uniref:Uncharacterized protein n=1 Tax=Romanomermis culicivorax TaxID=13658 RepID=A0A915IT07_ROMCU
MMAFVELSPITIPDDGVHQAIANHDPRDGGQSFAINDDAMLHEVYLWMMAFHELWPITIPGTAVKVAQSIMLQCYKKSNCR